MKNKLMIILGILLLFVHAVAADVSVELGEPYINVESFSEVRFKAHSDYYDICSLDETIIPVVVRNNNDFTDMFTFKVNRDYASLPTSSAFLGEGKSAILPLILSPPIDVEDNTSVMLDIITKREGLKRSLVIKTNIKKCYEFNLTIDKENEEICGCDEAMYRVMLSNEGEQEDTFDLKLDVPEWVFTNTSDSVKLFDGQRKEMSLLAVPDCEEKGNYDVVIEAISDKSNVVLRDSIELKVMHQKECYNTIIDVDDVRIDYFGKNIPVTLKNKGSKDMGYSLIAEGASWFSLSQTNFSIDSGEEKTINLALFPGEDVVEGEYTIDIKAEAAGRVFEESVIVKLRGKASGLGKFGFYLNYFKYYILVGVVLLFVILVLIVLIKNRMKDKPKVKKETEEKEVKKVPKVEKKETKKVSEKVVKESPRNGRKLRLFEYIYLILVVILFLAVIIYSIYKFSGVSSLLIQGIIAYGWYIVIGIVVLALLIFILVKSKGKKGKGKATKKAKVSKNVKAARKAKNTKKLRNIGIIILGLIILSGIVYSFAYFNLVSYVRDSLVVYYPYVLMGIGILVILILILNFHTKKIS